MTMSSIAELPTPADPDVVRLSQRLDATEQRLRAAERIIALLNDRLAWAEAEIATQALPMPAVRSPAAEPRLPD